MFSTLGNVLKENVIRSIFSYWGGGCSECFLSAWVWPFTCDFTLEKQFSHFGSIRKGSRLLGEGTCSVSPAVRISPGFIPAAVCISEGLTCCVFISAANLLFPFHVSSFFMFPCSSLRLFHGKRNFSWGPGRNPTILGKHVTALSCSPETLPDLPPHTHTNMHPSSGLVAHAVFTFHAVTALSL